MTDFITFPCSCSPLSTHSQVSKSWTKKNSPWFIPSIHIKKKVFFWLILCGHRVIMGRMVANCSVLQYISLKNRGRAKEAVNLFMVSPHINHQLAVFRQIRSQRTCMPSSDYNRWAPSLYLSSAIHPGVIWGIWEEHFGDRMTYRMEGKWRP